MEISTTTTVFHSFAFSHSVVDTVQGSLELMTTMMSAAEREVAMAQSVPQRFACPAKTCIAFQNNPQYVTGWQHTGCTAGKKMIHSSGDSWCTQCGRRAFLLDWKFKCNSSTHGTEYQAADFSDLIAVLSQASMYNDIDQEFVYDLINNLNTRFRARRGAR